MFLLLSKSELILAACLDMFIFSVYLIHYRFSLISVLNPAFVVAETVNRVENLLLLVALDNVQLKVLLLFQILRMVQL